MKEKISLIYKMIIVLVSGYALYINFKLLTFRQGILYFTNVSNLLCFMYFFVLVILILTHKEKKDDKHYIIKGMVTMAIALTMLMYNLYLSSDSSTNIFVGHQLETNMVHIVVPLLVIFDYIIFEEKGHLKKHYPLIWSAIVIIYQTFIFIYIAFGGKFLNDVTYPYPYMDISKYGVSGVVINLTVMFVLYVGFGTIIQMIDNKLEKKIK